MEEKKELQLLTEIVKRLIEEKGGSYEFDESVTITGQYGDRAGTKCFYVKDGKLYAHVYNVWMENMEACLEYNLLSKVSLLMLKNRIKNNQH